MTKTKHFIDLTCSPVRLGPPSPLVKKENLSSRELQQPLVLALPRDAVRGREVALKKEARNINDTDDFTIIGGDVGQVPCRDLPHMRFSCATFSMIKGIHTSNSRYCSKCYCYVCDVPVANCKMWGSGSTSRDHCNATRDKGVWDSLRRQQRYGKTETVLKAYEGHQEDPRQQYLQQRAKAKSSLQSSQSILAMWLKQGSNPKQPQGGHLGSPHPVIVIEDESPPVIVIDDDDDDDETHLKGSYETNIQRGSNKTGTWRGTLKTNTQRSTHETYTQRPILRPGLSSTPLGLAITGIRQGAVSGRIAGGCLGPDLVKEAETSTYSAQSVTRVVPSAPKPVSLATAATPNLAAVRGAFVTPATVTANTGNFVPATAKQPVRASARAVALKARIGHNDVSSLMGESSSYDGTNKHAMIPRTTLGKRQFNGRTPRCGNCKSCNNPSMKKACITNRALEEQGEAANFDNLFLEMNQLRKRLKKY